MTSNWFFLSTLNYDAQSATHQIYFPLYRLRKKIFHEVNRDLYFIINPKEYNLSANAMIIHVHYDAMYCCDAVGYPPSDVTSGALQL